MLLYSGQVTLLWEIAAEKRSCVGKCHGNSIGERHRKNPRRFLRWRFSGVQPFAPRVIVVLIIVIIVVAIEIIILSNNSGIAIVIIVIAIIT